MRAYFNIFISLSLFFSPLASMASPITRGGAWPNVTSQDVQNAVAGMETLNLKSAPADVTLGGFVFHGNRAITSWSEGKDTYQIVTTSFVTKTPAEYEAAVANIQQTFATAGPLGQNVNVVSIVPDNQAGEAIEQKLASAFTLPQQDYVLTLPLSQKQLSTLEHKLSTNGGILGKLQQSLHSAANWLTDRPQYYEKIFVVSRTILNGTAASTTFLLSYAGIHPAVAIAAGVSAGLLSGTIQKFSKQYAKFLVTEGPGVQFFKKAAQKLMPFLPAKTLDTWTSQMAMVTKYTALELLFVATPIAIFFGADNYSNILESSQWLTSVVGHGFEQFSYHFNVANFAIMTAISTFGQYPWDSTIAKLNEIDLAKAGGDKQQEKWIDFRTRGYFLGISALSVFATAAAFGNQTLGYSVLAGLGALGLYVGHRAVKRAEAYKNSCESFLTAPALSETTGYVTLPQVLDKTGS